MNPPDTRHSNRQGLAAAFGAYTIWGFLPLYLILVKTVPAVEFVAWRIIWTLPVCLVIVYIREQFGALRHALRDRRTMMVLAMTSALIALNWVVYIWSVQNGEIYAASLGYYINPLVNILLGTFVLGERLSRLQWAAVGIAGAGVAVLAAGAITTLWISLTLAFSFGLYGLLRKKADVGAVPGLTIESGILLLPSSLVVLSFAMGPDGSSFGQEFSLNLLIMLGGALTAIPLLMFATAARLLPYSTLGFIQYLAPTIVFILGLTVFDQPMSHAQLVCFVLIWIALGLFAWDMTKRRGKAHAAPARVS